MEQMREVALAYYENFSSEEKETVMKIFQKMDVSRDGKVSFGEYKKFMEENVLHKELNDESVFQWLDLDKSGNLDFEEIITLYYMLNKVLVCCNVCGALQMGAYFSCAQCFLSDCDTYVLCCNCYREKRYEHHGDAIFLDNLTLLHGCKNMLKEVQRKEVSSRRSKVAADGLKALKIALNVAETSSNITGCSIM